MHTLLNATRTALARPVHLIAVLAFATLGVSATPALAAAPQEVVDAYANMCVQMANNPGHIGDVDLKGNPQLQAYCSCFGRKFGDRAVTRKELLKSKEEQQAAQKEEMEMRNSCRSQLGLPPVPAKK